MPTIALAVRFDYQLDSGLRFQYTRNGVNFQSFPPSMDADVLGGSLLFGFLGLVEFHEKVEFSFTLDIGELMVGNRKAGVFSSSGLFINNILYTPTAEDVQNIKLLTESCKRQAKRQGVPESRCEEPHWLLQESFFLPELYFTFFLDDDLSVKLEIGSLEASIGNSFILDNYVLGIRLEADYTVLEKAVPLKFQFAFMLPDNSFTTAGKSSPVAHLEVTYAPAKAKEIGAYFVYMRDGDNLAGNLLLPLWQDRVATRLSQNFQKSNSHFPVLSCGPSNQQQLNALKSLLSKENQVAQKQCEQENEERKKRGEQPYACPADDINEQFARKVCDVLPVSSGEHFWLGIKGKGHTGKLSYRGNAVLYFSWMKLQIPKEPSEQSLLEPLPQSEEKLNISDFRLKGLGVLLELEAKYNWTKALSSSMFFLYSSGDQWDGENGTVYTFIGIAPQVRHTNVFFNGGINSYSSRRGISVGGVSGAGYLTPGFSTAYEIESVVEAKATIAAIWAPAAFASKSTQGSFYGFEFNLMGSFRLLKWLEPVLQFDFFIPGSFFKEQDGSLPTPLFQVLFGVNFVIE